MTRRRITKALLILTVTCFHLKPRGHDLTIEVWLPFIPRVPQFEAWFNPERGEEGARART